MKFEPRCLYCGHLKVAHTAKYMLCPDSEKGYLYSKYEAAKLVVDKNENKL